MDKLYDSIETRDAIYYFPKITKDGKLLIDDFDESLSMALPPENRHSFTLNYDDQDKDADIFDKILSQYDKVAPQRLVNSIKSFPYYKKEKKEKGNERGSERGREVQKSKASSSYEYFDKVDVKRSDFSVHILTKDGKEYYLFVPSTIPIVTGKKKEDNPDFIGKDPIMKEFLEIGGTTVEVLKGKDVNRINDKYDLSIDSQCFLITVDKGKEMLSKIMKGNQPVSPSSYLIKHYLSAKNMKEKEIVEAIYDLALNGYVGSDDYFWSIPFPPVTFVEDKNADIPVFRVKEKEFIKLDKIFTKVIQSYVDNFAKVPLPMYDQSHNGLNASESYFLQNNSKKGTSRQELVSLMQKMKKPDDVMSLNSQYPDFFAKLYDSLVI